MPQTNFQCTGKGPRTTTIGTIRSREGIAKNYDFHSGGVKKKKSSKKKCVVYKWRGTLAGPLASWNLVQFTSSILLRDIVLLFIALTDPVISESVWFFKVIFLWRFEPRPGWEIGFGICMASEGLRLDCCLRETFRRTLVLFCGRLQLSILCHSSRGEWSVLLKWIFDRLLFYLLLWLHLMGKSPEGRTEHA